MKKAISLILSAAFVCSLFAACSDKSVNEDGNNKSSENNIELKITTLIILLLTNRQSKLMKSFATPFLITRVRLNIMFRFLMM